MKDEEVALTNPSLVRPPWVGLSMKHETLRFLHVNMMQLQMCIDFHVENKTTVCTERAGAAGTCS